MQGIESSDKRLDRVVKEVYNSLSKCENEIRDTVLEKTIREQALEKENLFRSLEEQKQKLRRELEQYFDANIETRSRIQLSQEEINRIREIVKQLTNAKLTDISEIQPILENYQAQILHHEDIVKFESKKLEADERKSEELKNLILKYDRQEKRANGSARFSDEEKYRREIEELEGILVVLENNRFGIISLLDKIDPNRESDGRSKMVKSSEKKKRKLDSAFNITPENRPLKRVRPEHIVEQNFVPKPQEDEDEDEVIYPEVVPVTRRERNNNIETPPTLLVPFLPPPIKKLLGRDGENFDNIEWIDRGIQIPIYSDLSKTAFFQWQTIRTTPQKDFSLQTYTGVSGGITYRIVAIDSAHDILENDVLESGFSKNTLVIPIAVSKDEDQSLALFEILTKLEKNPLFEYEAVWRALCSGTK